MREACPSRQRAHVCEMQHSQHSPRALSWDVQLCPCAASARFVVENDHWDRKLSCSNARAITDRAEGGRRARGAACDSNAARHAEMHASHTVTLIPARQVCTAGATRYVVNSHSVWVQFGCPYILSFLQFALQFDPVRILIYRPHNHHTASHTTPLVLGQAAETDEAKQKP